jgi:hypothetical protein
MRTWFRLLLSASLMSSVLAHAQTAGTVTFTANKTSATGSLVPVLTWSTTPVASSCVGSGAWSGTKFASGSETLATITTSKSYTLTCTWNNGTANISWTAPTQNSDKSKLTDLTGYKVRYGTSASSLTQQQSVSGATAKSATVNALGGGTWYFAVRAVNSKQLESGDSNVAQKSIAKASAAKTVAIAISGSTTPPPTKVLKTVATVVYDMYSYNGVTRLGPVVGSIALGKTCSASYSVSSTYYAVNLSDVRITRTPRSSRVLAHCALQ